MGRSVFWAAVFCAAVFAAGMLGACGGPQEGPGPVRGASGQALSATPGSSQAGSATVVVDVSTRTVTVAGPNTPVVQPASYLVGGDSSPDPIPAQPKGDHHHAPPAAVQAWCNQYTDLVQRLACYLTLDR